MSNLDEEKIECALGNKELGFWQDKKADNVVFLFLTSGFAAFICWYCLIQTTRFSIFFGSAIKCKMPRLNQNVVVTVKHAVWINLLYWNNFTDCNEKSYRILFLPTLGIFSCGFSQGKIISVNWLLCYRFFLKDNGNVGIVTAYNYGKSNGLPKIKKVRYYLEIY